MSELSQGEETALLELVGPVFPRRSWLSGRQSVDIPAGDEQSCWVAHLATAPAGARLSLVPAAEWGGRMESDAAVEFFRTRCQPCRVRLVFTGILAGETEGGWDAVVMGTIRITDPVRFIEECGSRLVSVGVPVTIQLLGAWLVKRWAVTVGDWVRAAGEGFLAVEFREKGVLPAAVWTHRFNEWLADAGMEVAFEEVQWENAEAARAEAERGRSEEMTRIKAERQREGAAALRELAAKSVAEREEVRLQAQRQEALKQLEHERGLLEAARQHQREQIALEQQVTLEQVDAKLEQARLAAEQAAAERRRARTAQSLSMPGSAATITSEGSAAWAAAATTGRLGGGTETHCGSCGKRILTKLDWAGACQASGCGAVICGDCWAAREQRRCARHAGNGTSPI